MKKILTEMESWHIYRKKERKKERHKQKLSKKEEICKTPGVLWSYFSSEKITFMYQIGQYTEEV